MAGKPTSRTEPSLNKAMLGSLRGNEYQLLLTLQTLIKAGILMRQAKIPDNFECEIAVEDQDAGKFDDVIFHNTIEGVLKKLNVQAKNRMNEEKVAWNELFGKETKGAFSISKYFISFLELKQQRLNNKLDDEWLVLCTNVDLEDEVIGLMEKYHVPEACDIFSTLNASCYQFNRLKIESSKKYDFITKQLKGCSDSYNLANFLVEIIYNEKELDLSANNPQRPNVALVSKYNKELSSLVGTKREKNTHEVQEHFITGIELTPNEAQFRKVFEDVYKTQSGIQDGVWDDVKAKGIKVKGKAKPKDSSQAQEVCSKFPEDIISDEDIWMFFKHFIFATNAGELPTRIKGILSQTNIIGKADEQLGSVEVETAFNYLHNVIKNWIAQQSDLPAILKAEDVGKILQKCNLHLQHLKLKNLSDEYVKTLNNFEGCIKLDWLENIPLYNFLCSNEEVTHTFYSFYEPRIASSIVLETLKFHFEKHHVQEVIFIETMRYDELKTTVWDVLRLEDSPLFLIIECKDKPFAQKFEEQIITTFQSMDETAAVKKVILTAQIKTSNIEVSMNSLHLQDIVEGSLERIFPGYYAITIFGTQTLLQFIMQQQDDIGTLLDLMKDKNRTMIEYSLIDEHYRRIKDWYVERGFKIKELASSDNTTVKYPGELNSGVFFTDGLNEGDILDWEKFLSCFLLFKRNIGNIDRFFDSKEEHYHTTENLTYASEAKVHIILDEAGFGKTTFLSWLGNHFQRTQTTWWVVRFNSIDYSTDFKRLSEEEQPNPMDDMRALKTLYRMIHLALFVRNINHKAIQETDRERELADQCSNLMEILEGKLIVREEKLKQVDLTPLQLITLRFFVHHFNQQTIVILFDGFDELVPHYKEVVYDLLSRFEKCDGIHKIFITSRPYMLSEEFRELFTNVAFYELNPFSDENIVETVHRFMKNKFQQYLHNSNNVKCLLEGLTCTVKYYLGTFSQVPLFIRMALNVLQPLIETSVDFVNGTIDKTFFDSLETNFEELNLIDTFVTNKIFKANVEKIQLPEAASNISGAISSREKLKKYTQRMHSLLALYELFDPEERSRLQVDEELAIEYMHEVNSGDENSGIIEAVVDDRPIFLHRTFADYFAAMWFYRNIRKNPKVISFLKSFSFWDANRREIRNFFDRMLITESGRKPIHLVVLGSFQQQTAGDMLKRDPSILHDRDAGGRTTLHLQACHRYNEEWGYFCHTWKHIPNLYETFQSCVNSKDTLLQWSPVDYAMIKFNEGMCYDLLTFGGTINTNQLIDVILSQDPSIIIRKTYEYGKFLTRKDPHNKVKIVIREFQTELRRRVADFMIDKKIDLHCPIVDQGGTKLTPLEYYVSTNDRPMFHALVQRAGGLDKVMLEKDVGPLILQAFARNSAHVLEFLICECQCDVPTAIDDVQLYRVIEESVVHSLNALYNILFKLQRSREDDQDDLLDSVYKSFSYAYNFVEQGVPNLPNEKFQEMFQPPEIDTKILNLLRKSFKNTNINAAKLLMQDARLDINSYTYPFIVKSMEESKLKDVAVHWECEDNLIHLIDTMNDPHRTDKNGKTLLHIALENNCFHIAQHLIDEKQFPLHQADTANRWNAFHYCLMKQSTIEKKYQKIQYELDARRKLFTYMMEKDPFDCIKYRDATGRNLLHLAVMNQHYSEANVMLKPILEKCPPDELESVANAILSESEVIGTARYNFNLKRLEKADTGFYFIDG